MSEDNTSTSLTEWQIVVCIKPVPSAVKQLPMPDSYNIVNLTKLRQESELIINPLDRHALELAVTVKEEWKRNRSGPLSITCISMAPPAAAPVLQHALAAGADRAILLSDPAMAGADTLATARTIAAAIRKLGPVKLVLTGAYSLDGATAQVGPQLATLLGWPHVSNITSLQPTPDYSTTEATMLLEDGLLTFEVALPAVFTVHRSVNTPRIPGLLDIINARRKETTVWKLEDLDLEPHEVGQAGSPTCISSLYKPALSGRRGLIFSGPASTAVAQLIAELRSKGAWPE